MQQNLTIIGFGEIGSHVLDELLLIKNNNLKLNVVDIKFQNKDIILLNNKYKSVSFFQNQKSIKSNIILISVYKSEQVLDVIKNINYSLKPLIIIESTIHPNICEDIEKIIKINNSFLSYFPHRYNPNDKEHQIFNQKRILGPINEESKIKSLNFLLNYMKQENIIITNPKIAILSKIIENSYRFTEIALAEEIALYLDNYNLDFNELRKCVNSKWNINLKEARDGIYGKCLEKDLQILNNIFCDNILFNSAYNLDKKYKLYKKNIK